MRLPRLRRSREDTLAPPTAPPAPVAAAAENDAPTPTEQAPRGLAKWQALLGQDPAQHTTSQPSATGPAVGPDVIVRSPVVSGDEEDDDQNNHSTVAEASEETTAVQVGLGSSRSRNSSSSPRWLLADHADATVRQNRANAQLGALSALCPALTHPLLCD
jgi:hypothetical protein